MRRTIFTALALAIALYPAGASAGKGNKGKGKKHDGDKHADVDVDITLHFGDRDRDVVRKYFVETHGRGHCPPGLAKKNNGCLPPGQAKKRYVVGRPLPTGVVAKDLPRDVSVRLGQVPKGYRYAVVDGDVVKLAVATGLVVDAIDALVD